MKSIFVDNITFKTLTLSPEDIKANRMNENEAESSFHPAFLAAIFN